MGEVGIHCSFFVCLVIISEMESLYDKLFAEVIKRFIERSYDLICELLVYSKREKGNFWGHFIYVCEGKKGVMTTLPLRYKRIQIDSLALFLKRGRSENHHPRFFFFFFSRKSLFFPKINFKHKQIF